MTNSRPDATAQARHLAEEVEVPDDIPRSLHDIWYRGFHAGFTAATTAQEEGAPMTPPVDPTALMALAEKEGESALAILASIREYRAREPYALRMANGFGGWFDCECGDCISEGHDFHAWEAFNDNAQDAIHHACLILAERDWATLRSLASPEDERRHE